MAGRLKVILFLCACAAPALGQATIPDTPAGQALSAWLEAFNSGDRARIDVFLKSHAPGLAEAAVTSAQFRGQSGGVNLLAVTRNERNTIAFRLQEKSRPTVLTGKIEVTAVKSPTIVNFVLRAVPSGAVLEDIKLDAALRSQTIEAVILNLNQFYVYPAEAEKMAGALRAHEKKGDYNSVIDGEEFASLLTKHLLEVNHDKHLNVYYHPFKFISDPPVLTFEELNEDRKAMARDCGIRKVDILPNNIGYMKFDYFSDPMACGRTAAAAISFLANTDAVIIDLRDNSGGDPRMVALICTYFFDKAVHLNDFYDRAGNLTATYWTLRYVPGVRLGQKPAYVLTSSRTFSGAEEFAYDLKNLKRITVVGETTGGAAHAVSPHQAGDHFTVFVPNSRSVSPQTNTDWEGTGVVPDVAVHAEDALDTAQRLAAQTIQRNSNRPTGEALAPSDKKSPTAAVAEQPF